MPGDPSSSVYWVSNVKTFTQLQSLIANSVQERRKLAALTKSNKVLLC